MIKTMDAKLDEIRANPDSNAFIICFAADADMGGGLHPFAGIDPSLSAWHDMLGKMIKQEKLDILLTSVSAMDTLARDKKLFADSPMTPSIRANDATDIWLGHIANYNQSPSRPFATTTIEEAQYGTLLPAEGQTPDVNLGLYSLTFNNDIDADLHSLEVFKQFRIEAKQKGFRYFLEVFNPNAPVDIQEDKVPKFVNDSIGRMIAGIPRDSRPDFLKIPYNGPQAMEDLVTYTSVIPGILGGPASTHYDTFKLLAEAKKHGARVALFGRRIKGAEDPLVLVDFMREVADGNISPEEATKAYHGAMQSAGIKPHRSLDDDMVIHSEALKA